MLLSFLFLFASSKKTYLTFDVYGTLLNISTVEIEVRKMAEECNVDPFDAYSTYKNYADIVCYGEDYSDFDETLRKALFWTDLKLKTNNSCFVNNSERLINVFKNFKPFPETLATLQEMKNRGYEIYIMSNSANIVMDENRKALGDLFGDHVFLAQYAKAYKPQLQFFQYVHEKLDFDHNNHTHIAQGFWSDIMPASLMKWENKIWVNRKHTLPSSKFEPFIEVSTLDQALEYLPPVENTD
ncbi:HAD superfamily hydrolase [Tritrichomonas foetus]|uniref:HAD superfamily hydrolase n=1 Tax=Tritrichomonas foetus TaxID=1144522 RepID=A0A1J4KWT2_9EUKA|nr:HAD superfamily hydrolase [Tritrichomonas foetus]|eukprot:OHT13997.1 HAD superfamily hydrolase [Tritrichomonas foetus]